MLFWLRLSTRMVLDRGARVGVAKGASPPAWGAQHAKNGREAIFFTTQTLYVRLVSSFLSSSSSVSLFLPFSGSLSLSLSLLLSLSFSLWPRPPALELPKVHPAHTQRCAAKFFAWCRRVVCAWFFSSVLLGEDWELTLHILCGLCCSMVARRVFFSSVRRLFSVPSCACFRFAFLGVWCVTMATLPRLPASSRLWPWSSMGPSLCPVANSVFKASVEIPCAQSRCTLRV